MKIKTSISIQMEICKMWRVSDIDKDVFSDLHKKFMLVGKNQDCM